MLLDIVSGNGLGIRAHLGVAGVLIVDYIDSKTLDTMRNLTYCYMMKISLVSISKCFCCSIANLAIPMMILIGLLYVIIFVCLCHIHVTYM